MSKVRQVGQQAALVGVPLGGMGAGAMELCRDGVFRNVTINNNRTVATRIGALAKSFFAVRAARRGRVDTRILQTHSDVGFEDAGIVPTYAAQDSLAWTGLYPAAQFRLDDNKFPLEVNWSAIGPIVPYDVETSTLPLILVEFHVRNPTDSAYDASVMFNWENISGCDQNNWPEDRGGIRKVEVRPTPTGLPEDDSHEHPPVLLGITAGPTSTFRNNTEGNYALVARDDQQSTISYLGWNGNAPDDVERFWSSFYDEGTLPNVLPDSIESHMAAVCKSFTLEATRARSVAFVLAWYCPRYDVDGEELGNGYTNSFKSSVDVALCGLRECRYILQAVESWQKRFMTSTFPRWFSKMLVNNNSVLSTNTMYTRSGDFTFIETPEDPVAGALDKGFYSSIGPLLFYPELSNRELMLLANGVEAGTKGRVHHHLGKGTLSDPGHRDDNASQLELNCKLVLMAYRNYLMTGSLVMLRNVYPKLREAMGYVLTFDRNRDGLPEQSGCCTMYPDWAMYGVDSYTCSLWLAALRAYLRMARRMNDTKEIERYQLVLARGAEAFTKRLWNDEEEYFRLYHDAEQEGDHPPVHDGCHVGQLAGEWYAHFLELGRLFPEDRVKKALDAMCRLNEKDNGVATAHMPDGSPCTNPGALPDPRTGNSWPHAAASHYVCLHIYEGNVDRGLYSLQRMFKNMYAKGGYTFNQPLEWDIDANGPVGWGKDRHMGAAAIWHAFFAVEGFLFDAPEQAVWIRPNLPLGVESLSAPLFTPSCFGWLTFKETHEAPYRQWCKISFDSPVQLKTVHLSVPSTVKDVQVRCISDEGEEGANYEIDPGKRRSRVDVTLKHPVLVGSSFQVTLTARQPEPVPAT